MHKKQTHRITLLSLIVFCLYIFINILFPYANIISASFLSISTGLLLYCLFNANERLVTLSLAFAFLSIIVALFQHFIIT